MYTVYQSVSRISLPTSLTLGHLPPGGRFVGRETRPLLTDKWQFDGSIKKHSCNAAVFLIYEYKASNAALAASCSARFLLLPEPMPTT